MAETEELEGPFFGLDIEKSDKKYRIKLIKKPTIKTFPELKALDVGLVDKITIENFEGTLRAIEKELSLAGLIKKCKIVKRDEWTELQCEGIKEKKKEVT